MSELIPDFKLHSDIAIADLPAISVHKDLINKYEYTDATNSINNTESLNGKGFRSSFFNAIENKIRDLQIYLLNKNASPDEYYSLTEPTDEEMVNKIFWIKPIE